MYGKTEDMKMSKYLVKKDKADPNLLWIMNILSYEENLVNSVPIKSCIFQSFK